MRVSEILRIKGHTLFTTTPGGLALDAVRVMAQHDIGSLVVMDHGRLAGMLTFREVLRGARASATACWARSPSTRSTSAIPSRRPRRSR